MMNFFLKHTDVTSDGSFVNKIRDKRMQAFHSRMDGKRTILDVGGTVEFWKRYGKIQYDITVLNVFKQESLQDNVHCIVGDAADLSGFEKYDMVFSNSVLEHVSNQRMVATGMFGVGKHGFIQTPSYWSPFEPHYMIPGFQFLPRSIKALLIWKFNLGRRVKQNSYADALNEADSVNLLTKLELKKMYPDCNISTEMLFGFPISYIIEW